MPRQPLAGVMLRCAQEAHRQADMAARFDEAYGALALAGATALPHAPLWQQLDLHRQSLRDLARFMEALARALPEEVAVDTAAPAQAMTLGALADRVAPSGSAAHPAAPQQSGEADFF
ncbi:hypothetical protein [Alkalilacustris brevis]|uniref:hypothetical protein n=1 Tax=Alkalilacustris brevis TaxID=2026338 RepID=UPI0012D32E4D|nr:hypothetical protein [Alkalilacustris brevis]